MNKSLFMSFALLLSTANTFLHADIASLSTSYTLSNGTTITLKQGDISKSTTEVIVVPSNPQLCPEAGAGKALLAKAGREEILAECQKNNPLQDDVYFTNENGNTDSYSNVRCQAGNVVVTASGALKEQGVKNLIHAVGPIMEVNKAALLAAVYANALQAAEREKLSSITFPAIATGAHGFPLAEATKIALTTMRDHFAHSQTSSVQNVQCVFFSEQDYKTAEKTAEEVLN